MVCKYSVYIFTIGQTEEITKYIFVIKVMKLSIKVKYYVILYYYCIVMLSLCNLISLTEKNPT